MIHPDMPADADKNFTDQDVGSPVRRCDGKDPTKFKVRFVRHDGNDFRKSNAARSKTHEVVSETSRADRDEVLITANHSLRGDIFVSDMHTLFRKGDEHKTRPPPLGIDPKKGQKNLIPIDDLCAELKAGGPPAAVVLMGCWTQPLLAKVIAAGVGAAFGIAPKDPTDPLVPFPVANNSHAAADLVTKALMEGQTLEDAAEAATNVMSDEAQAFSSVAAVMVVVECGSCDPKRSLQDNRLLYLKAP